MVHDELVYVVPEADAQQCLDELQQIMRSGVSWWPELVTWSEGDIAKSYGSAK
jgi:DNA polymerase I-like protein with 3'-5' exonuclease and polymerase domains